jgi:dolichol-phosphate mannosyltransferase
VRHVEGLLSPRKWAIVRWWVVGGAFAVITIPLLYVLHEVWGLPLPLATLIGGEIATLARFLINDRWVFGNRFPTWRRLIEYHVAVLSGSLIWYAVTNLLPQWGVQYLVASIIGQLCSVGWSMVTNFAWVWRPRAAAAATLAALEPTVGAIAVDTVEP